VTGTLALVGAWLVVGLVPGLLVVASLRPRAGVLRNLALAPLASYGLLMAVAAALAVGGVPIAPATVLPIAVGVGVLCLAVGLVSRGGRSTSLPLRLVDLLPLGLVMALGAAVWWWASDGLAAVPPNDDGSNHGLFTTQILREETLAPGRVVVGDVITDDPSGSYYPFAMHLVAALVARLSGSPVAPALTLQVVVAMVALPAGMLVLTRRLFPARPGAAPVAAVLAVAFTAVPWYLATWGGYPFIAGMALLAIAVDALAGASEDGRVWATGVVVGLVLVGLFTLHSSEMVAAVGMALLLLIGGWARRERGVADSLAPWGVGLAVLAAVLLPQWRAILAGSEAVATAALYPRQELPGAVGGALYYLVSVPEYSLVIDDALWLRVAHVVSGVAIWLLVLLGVNASVRHRWSPEWAIGLGLLLVVTVMSALRLPLVDALTVPWYSRWDRLIVNGLVFLAPLGALGVAALVTPVRAGLHRWAVGAAITLVVAPSLLMGARLVSIAFDRASLAGPDQRAALAWLADNVPDGQRVLNDPTDGSAWMWALDSVPPLFAVGTHQIGGWGDRLYLQEHAAEVDSDPRARAAAAQWNVRFAYVGPSVYPGREAALSAEEMVTGGQWRVVFSSGGATVLQRVG